MVRMLLLGGTEACRTRFARQFRHHRMRIDMAGPPDLGVCLLGSSAYDVVAAFFRPDLATRFVEACLLNRIDPQLVILAPGLRHQRAQLQRALSAAHLPAAIFFKGEADDAEVRSFLTSLIQTTSAARIGSPPACLQEPEPAECRSIR